MNATRRKIIIGATAQVAAPLVFAAEDFAVAQNKDIQYPKYPPGRLKIGDVDLTPKSPDQFVDFFFRLWNVRMAISFAEFEGNAQQELQQLAEQAMTALQREKEYTAEIATQVAVNTANLQNIIVRYCTDAKSGVVRITSERLQAARDYYCSFYPYCR